MKVSTVDDIEYEFHKAEERFKNYPSESNFSLDLWRIVLLTAIVVRYFTVTFSYVYLENVDSKLYFFIVALDAVYVFDYFACVFHHLSDRFQFRVRSRKELVVDFFISFPYCYCYQFFSYSYYNNTLFMCLRHIILIHFYHLLVFLKEKWNSVETNHVKYFAFHYFLFFAIIVHGLSCVWYCVADNTWLKQYGFDTKYQLPSERYFICFYFILENFTNRSFGDFVPMSVCERLMIMVTMCVGFILVIGIFTATVSFLLDTTLKRRSTLKTQYEAICDHLKRIPQNLVKRHTVENYYKLLWSKKRGVSEAKQFSLLPQSLRCVISLDLNIGFLNSRALFSDKPDAFLRVLSNLMKHEFYQLHELIYRRGTFKDKMIFVAYGAIEVLSDDNDESSVVTLGPGTCIGENALTVAFPVKNSVRAACHTELQVLYRRDFFTIINLFPQAYSDIREKIMERIAANAHRVKVLNQEALDMDSLLKRKYVSCELELKAPTKDEHKVCLSDTFPWILQPKSSLRTYWEIFIIVVALFIAAAYPHFITFVRKSPEWFDTIKYCIDFILVVDLCIILTTAIEEEKNTTDTFIKITRKRLTQAGFYCDFVSCLKLELYYWIWTKNTRVKDVLQLNRLLKIYRVAKFFRNHERRIEHSFYFVCVAKHVFYLLLFVYWFSNLLYLITCFEDACSEDGWLFVKLTKDSERQLTNSYISHELLATTYYGLSCLSGLTLGDVVAGNLADVGVTCLGLILGVSAFSCCVAQLSTSIIHKRRLKTNFEEVLFSVRDFLKRNQVDRSLVQRIKEYLVLQWYFNKGLALNERPLLYDANSNLRAQIELEEKLEAIKRVALFNSHELNFVVEIAEKATTLLLPPNELVICKREICEVLYIIYKGYCIRQFEKSFIILGPHSVFEALCFFTDIKSLCTVKTLTHVKLVCISKKEFWKAAARNPTTMKPFLEIYETFDVAEECKQFRVRASISQIINLEDENVVFEGSFVNVLWFCRDRNEDYSQPFMKLGAFRLTQGLLMPICILPYGLFLKLWMTLRLALAVAIVVLTPYQIAHHPNTPYLDQALISIDVITFVDLYIMMLVGYYESKNQLVIHPLKTASHFLQGKFLLDFLLCCPWQIPASLFTNDENWLNVIRIVKVGQIYRLPQFFNHMTDIKKKINSNILQMLKYVPVTFVLINFWAAITVIHSRTSSGYNYSNGTVRSKENYWISKLGAHDVHEYVSALYSCTQILTSCGFGDLPPTFSTTLVLTIIMNICGVVFFSYIYASISSHKAYWYNFLFKYREVVMELKQFMEREKVTKQLQHEIIDQMKYEWKRRRGVDVNGILSKLHATLFENTMYANYEKTLKLVAVFSNLEPALLKLYTRNMKEKYYFRGETVYEADDIVSELCIVRRGTVKILSKEGEVFLKAGGVFGNLTANSRHKSNVTAVALNNVDLLCLETRDFYDGIQKYETVKKNIERKLRGQDFTLPTIKDSSKNKTSDISLSNVHDNLTTKGLATHFSQMFLICLPWKLCAVTIFPDSLTFKIFDNYCLIITYFGTILTTYDFAFQNHPPLIVEFSMFLDFSFISKMVLEMHRAFQDVHGEMITSNKKIILHYYRKQKLRRLLELIISFPFYYFVFFALLFTKADPYFWFSQLRMLTLFRLIYLLDYYADQSNQLMTNQLVCKTSCMFIWSTLMVHFFACGWYLCACPFTSCFEASWIRNVHKDNSSSKLDVYVSCVYFVVTTVTATASGDITASNRLEQIYVMVIMIASVFLIGIFIGEIWNLFNSTTVAQVRYDYDINELKDCLECRNLSEFQLKKTWRYVQQLWTVSNGNQIPLGVTYLHPVTLYKLMGEIYGHHIRNTYVFSEAEDAFIRQLCQYLKRNIFFPGNYIVQHGDIDSCMYFIHLGEVDILTVHSNLTETVHDILHSGDIFGVLQGLFPKVPHHFSYRARTNVHVIILQMKDWEHLLDFFPESKDSIFSKAANVQF